MDEEIKKQVLAEKAKTNGAQVITNKVRNLLKEGNLPFIPNNEGYCNVKPVKNVVSNTRLSGSNMLIAKIHLHEMSKDNDNVLTFKQATDYKTYIKRGEKGFNLSFYDKENNKTKYFRYFAESQTQAPDVLPYHQTVPESKKRIFIQKSSDPQDYITNYLKCVDENRSFTASTDVVKEFKNNFDKALEKDHIAIFKFGNEAGKAIYKEKNPEKAKAKELAMVRACSVER